MNAGAAMPYNIPKRVRKPRALKAPKEPKLPKEPKRPKITLSVQESMMPMILALHTLTQSKPAKYSKNQVILASMQLLWCIPAMLSTRKITSMTRLPITTKPVKPQLLMARSKT